MSLNAPLSLALHDPRPGDAVVAFGRGREHTRRELAERAAGLAGALAEAGAGRWLLLTDDAFAAAVSLVAVAHAGAMAVLPPNRQPETLRRLAAGARGLLCDGLATAAEPVPRAETPALPVLAALAPRPALPRLPDPPDRSRPFLQLHTSGTTGEGRAVPKALSHLEDEVATLDSVFGAGIAPAARVFATVPHQHVYGLLFRLLWPLASGRPFQVDTLLHPQELLPLMAACGSSALVTTPAHLKRSSARDGLRDLRGTCQAVFSSGGLLDAETAKNVAAALGAAPWEVLGSTETGGVAVRRRDRDGESWRPLPGVEVACEADSERLLVRSPYVSVGEPSAGALLCFRMGDRARLAADGSFLLLGRADRTAKVGEKRVSLDDMERDLGSHALVDEAALVVLDQGSDPRVHAAVVASPLGRDALRRGGRRAVRLELQKHLALHWDRVLLPRAWRFVDVLPRNAQGKLPQGALEALFERGREPVTSLETRSEHGLERRLSVPADLVYFDGHFDDLPLVPGVVQLRWALDAAADLMARRPRVLALEALKFPEPLPPGQAFTLRVELSPSGDRLGFRLYEGERVFASGRARLARPGAAGG